MSASTPARPAFRKSEAGQSSLGVTQTRRSRSQVVSAKGVGTKERPRPLSKKALRCWRYRAEAADFWAAEAYDALAHLCAAFGAPSSGREPDAD
jgi:hypothetical protein